MTRYFARSGDDKKGIPPQTYQEHVSGTRERCRDNLVAMLRYSSDEDSRKLFFQYDTLLSAEYHDLGKLDPANQKVLCGQYRTIPLPYRHDDAGCALLMKHFSAVGLFPVVLIHSHHRGIPNINVEECRGDYRFRRYCKNESEGSNKREHIDSQLEAYWKIHQEIFPEKTECYGSLKCNGLRLRLALSCLVDADHADAARWGKNADEKGPVEGKWCQRLDALDQYIAQMDNSSARDQDRNAVYRACREGPLNDGNMETCSSPVGTGKTTAVMARLLRYAIKYNLRHIFVVLPFTNIIQQSVEVYRKALVLPGENSEEVVAEHHHVADFSDPEFRTLSSLWKSPIIVTTAVQFFETLGSNNPVRLRKLHELPGSAIFVDEAHAAMPLRLWPQEWKWLRGLAKKWTCPIVLGSGSLSKIWENEEFMGKKVCLPDVLPEVLRDKLQKVERERIVFQRESSAWGLTELKEHLMSDHGGAKLVVLNTVRSAASLALTLRQAGADVLHLSTALAPRDRANIMEKIKRRLNPDNPEFRVDWILVATSCVEAGVNFSFAKGYRECSALVNLIQISGRVRRHFEPQVTGKVVSFMLSREQGITLHPGFNETQNILNNLFREKWFDGTHSIDEILDEEFQRQVDTTKVEKQELLDAESGQQFERVAQLCKVIDEDTCLVVIDQELANRLKNREKVNYYELQRNSVQIGREKVEKLNIEKITEDLYLWTRPYDPDFLGYMTPGAE